MFLPELQSESFNIRGAKRNLAAEHPRAYLELIRPTVAIDHLFETIGRWTRNGTIAWRAS